MNDGGVLTQAIERCSLDRFDWQARFSPFALVWLPPILFVAVILLDGVMPMWGRIAAVLLLLAGTLYACAQIGRDAGKRIEPRLWWQDWGAPPVVLRLRHRDAKNPHLLRRQHKQIERLTETALPTVDEEHDDPHDADLRYDAAVVSLIEATKAERVRFPRLQDADRTGGVPVAV